MNGKRDHFTLDDFRQCAKAISMKRGRAEIIIDEVRAAVANWLDYADQADVSEPWRLQINQNLRLEL